MRPDSSACQFTSTGSNFHDKIRWWRSWSLRVGYLRRSRDVFRWLRCVQVAACRLLLVMGFVVGSGGRLLESHHFSHRQRIGTAYRSSPKEAMVSPSYSTTPPANRFPAACLSLRNPRKSEAVTHHLRQGCLATLAWPMDQNDRSIG